MSENSKGYSAAQSELLRIGTTRIAYWTKRTESAVYKWLKRRPADAPIPPELLPAVKRGADAEEFPIDLKILWPEGQELAV